MDRITIKDLAVQWRVGVPDEERATPQKLLITIELDLDFAAAARFDNLRHTINYDVLCRRVRQWGEGKSWKLIEGTAVDTAAMIMAEFRPAGVSVEVQKFILPDTAYVVREGKAAELSGERRAGANSPQSKIAFGVPAALY